MDLLRAQRHSGHEKRGSDMGLRALPISRVLALLVFGATVFLSACSANKRLYEGANGGFVVASLGVRSDTPYSMVRLAFRRRGGGGESGVFWASDPLLPGPKADFDSASNRGVVGSVRLAPGEYEFYNFLASIGNTDYSARNDFSIPFTVDAGSVTYLGEFSFAAHWTKGLFGLEAPSLPVVSIADQQARDIPIIKTRVPETASANVRVAVPDPGMLSLPFFLTVPPPIHQR
jgi:hypothetical protein